MRQYPSSFNNLKDRLHTMIQGEISISNVAMSTSIILAKKVEYTNNEEEVVSVGKSSGFPKLTIEQHKKIDNTMPEKPVVKQQPKIFEDPGMGNTISNPSVVLKQTVSDYKITVAKQSNNPAIQPNGEYNTGTHWRQVNVITASGHIYTKWVPLAVMAANSTGAKKMTVFPLSGHQDMLYSGLGIIGYKGSANKLPVPDGSQSGNSAKLPQQQAAPTQQQSATSNTVCPYCKNNPVGKFCISCGRDPVNDKSGVGEVDLNNVNNKL